ncbi:uncharacterized protein UV8b_04252 [Ustilaginoidea virens]|uniref:Uncharacterized protein n=1 Tax=Ustilaginoidea virens TaxID=1159556 RepID=A0A063C4K9_USTVR|nr:uncharacterized protein UV8b_04252 [Ustilaginoidea virens]QUC20011.1 hypothetical protein UV8b_04252 [Ustilaginoidea virens]GAO15201.1 hypothetical protein UVI_02007070 [Ustilaginoidea virens]
MASGTFFDAKKTLLLSPFVSSTCSLLFAWDQHVFLGILTHAELRDRGNAILPTYWRVMFPWGLTQVIGLLGITTWTSIGAMVWNKDLLRRRGALPWYAATAGLAVGHLVFAPFVAPLIKFMMDDEGGRPMERKRAEPGHRNVEAQGEWLGWNMTRLLTTDLGAWLCCAVAVTKTFSLEQPAGAC